jgi:hypothetical protein
MYDDDKMGRVWLYSTTPVTLTSGNDYADIFLYMDSFLPSGISHLPTPWTVKWRITNAPITIENMDLPAEFVDMRVQGLASTWATIQDVNVMAYKSMTGTLSVDFNNPLYTRYRVQGKVFPNILGRATSITLLMGVANFL